MTRDVERLLPLTPVVYHMLLALVDGRSHGYAIAQEVERRTGGQIRIGPGTLYGSLQRMREMGLIAECQRDEDATRQAERRRYYEITPMGESVLRAETRRLSHLVRFAEERLGLGGAGADR